jgi:hypothetical protein
LADDAAGGGVHFSGDSGSVVKSASVAINMARLSEMNGSTVVRSAVNITENGIYIDDDDDDN